MSTNQKPRILIVDDMIVNLSIMEAMLSDMGVDCDCTMSGKSCIDMCTKKVYDLVFLDQLMPGLNGVETLEKLLALFEQRKLHTPVICYTAEDDSDEISGMKRGGFTDVLLKPADPLSLHGILSKYISSKYNILDVTEEDTEGLDEEYKKLPDWLRNTKEIDARTGVDFCGSSSEYLGALRVFAESVDEKSREIEEYLHDRNNAMLLLRAHSLKSVSRMIGAKELSEVALRIETLARKKNYDAIFELSGECLELYRSIGDILKPVLADTDTGDNKAPLPPISEKTFNDAKNAITELVLTYDRDNIKLITDILSDYSLSEEDGRFVSDIREHLRKMEWEEMRECCGVG